MLTIKHSGRKQRASSYIAQYPVLGTVQSVLHFTSLADLFSQTRSLLVWEASSRMLQLMREGCSYTYPTQAIARYTFIQLSELEQYRVKNLAQGCNTAAQDSNPDSRNRESEALPLCHCALQMYATSSYCTRLLCKQTSSDTVRTVAYNTVSAYCKKCCHQKITNIMAY